VFEEDNAMASPVQRLAQRAEGGRVPVTPR